MTISTNSGLLLLISLLIILGAGCTMFNDRVSFKPKDMAYVLQITKRLGKTRAEQLSSLRNTNRDVIVMDYSAYGGEDSKWSKAEINNLKRNGETKVICYLSIGEAEDYRWYWKKDWNLNKPKFLCDENENWKGNFKVKYWDKQWQNVIISYLDEIVAQGFDGIYLDIIDGFQFFEYDSEKNDWIDNRINPATNQTYRKDMIDFVIKLAEHARSVKSDFVVIPQNGSELLNSNKFVDVIDAIGIEDLYTVGNKKQSDVHTQSVLKNLQQINKASKPVLLIEYPKNRKMKKYLSKLALPKNFSLLLTDRPLKTLGLSIVRD